jgi:hypothetical protein
VLFAIVVSLACTTTISPRIELSVYGGMKLALMSDFVLSLVTTSIECQA